jgi:hypothetical protein
LSRVEEPVRWVERRGEPEIGGHHVYITDGFGIPQLPSEICLRK